ncbi:SDR family NAD(P)-dependent oxidoreductase [Legionella dresdenensis]|uniref:SDR family NAD(P)-dependent oxidoreductase n=1 Tax=Legionella dresdenensis TaxID=450200 RepID=A0ABV8CGB8_9GAMM
MDKTSPHSEVVDVTDPCVVVAASVELPSIHTLEALWEELCQKRERNLTPSQHRQRCDELSLTNANLLNDWGFVNQYGISSSELSQVDPQQYLAIHVIDKAIKSVNLSAEILQSFNTGVFAGVMSVDHLHRMIEDGVQVDSRFFLNHCEASIANKASHFFNFTGSSKTVNAACASSLIAVQDACLSLEAGVCDWVFVVGVNHIGSSHRYRSFRQAGMISRSGSCNTFAMHADGYIPLEGAVCLLLTRQSLAKQLYLKPMAKIIGICSNHNGTTPSMTAPSVKVQSDLLARTKEMAASLDLNYVETHGTGTSLGDPIELEAIQQHYPNVYIGSIKANLGHLEAGAGLLGMLKGILVLQHQQIPPHHMTGQANLLMPANLQINETMLDYPHRHVAVSSFGFGGSNGHAILESVASPDINISCDRKLPLLLAAKDKDNLQLLKTRLRQQYQHHDNFITHFALSQLQQRHLPEQRTMLWLLPNGDLSEWQDTPEKEYCIELDFANEAICLELYNICLNYLPAPVLIEAYGTACQFALRFSHTEGTMIRLNNQDYWSFQSLDKYIKELSDLPQLHDEQFSQFIKQCQSIYQYQYTFKAFAHASNNSLLINCLQHAAIPAQTESLILQLLWLRVQLTQKWSLQAAEEETLQTFPWQYREWIALFKQEICSIEDAISIINGDVAIQALLSNRLPSRIKSIDYRQLPRLAELKVQRPNTQDCNDGKAHCLIHLNESCIIQLVSANQNSSSIDHARLLQFCWLNGVDARWDKDYQDMPFYRQGIIAMKQSEASLYTVCHHYKTNSIAKDIRQIQFEEKVGLTHYQQLLSNLHQLINENKKPVLSISHPDKLFLQHAELLGKAISLEFGDSTICCFDTAGHQYHHSLVELKPNTRSEAFKTKGHYVITGGTGGLGLELCNFLCEKYEATVILIGRKAWSELSTTVKERIDSPQINYVQCDISNTHQWLRQLHSLSEKQPIDALFHLAIATNDQLFVQMTAEELQRALKERWDANAWLASDQLTSSVKAIHVFASIQAYFPNLGGSIYCYESLIKSTLLRQSPHPVKTLSYLGVIDGIGLAARSDYRQYLSQYHMRPIRFDELVSQLACQIAHHVPEAIITKIDRDDILMSKLSDNLDNNLADYVILSVFCQLCQATESFQGHFQLLYAELKKLWQEKELSLDDVENYQKEILRLRQLLLASDYRGRLSLFDTVINQYSQIMNRSIPAHQVIFPSGQTDLVESFYKGHSSADFANIALARELRELIDRNKKLRILEVGAGSGATTLELLSQLKPQDQIEYTFTDISQALVNKARSKLSSPYAHMNFCALNIDDIKSGHPFEKQFDVIIATNVIHATPSILETLQKLKRCLNDQGTLLVNELIEKTPYTTAIFGLFEGWWKTQDSQYRIQGSPLLCSFSWLKLLKEVGLTQIKTIASPLHSFNPQQQVFVATMLQEKDTNELNPSCSSPDGFSLEDLKSRIAATLHIDSNGISASAKLSELGFDSLSLSDLYQKLRPHFNSLSIADLFADHSVASLAGYLGVSQHQQEERKGEKAGAPVAEKDIAIIGLSYQLPHGGYESFEAMLEAGGTAFSEVPVSRWAQKDYFHKEPMPGHNYASKGSFLENIDCFDAAFFTISPREARLIDPQERLLLQNAYHALEAGGCLPVHDNNQIGVFIGLSGNYYSWCYEWQNQSHANSACSYWSAANRISYALNLHGPSLTVDTACSSSLTALHLACQSLLSGETEIALAGAANLIVHPRQMVELSDLRMLSPTDQNNSFAENGDGFVYAEGIVVLCLKRLSQAIEDGDYIHAVIKATALNSGGKTHGYTVPNVHLQEEVIQKALTKANIQHEQVCFVETHGTATKLGDPIETKALSTVFTHSLGISSVKSNMGHSEACAGFAGLVKLILQYRNNCLYGNAHSLPLNPYCDFDQNKLRVLQSKEQWSVAAGSRLCGLSSFGAGGSNGHAILSDYVNQPKAETLLYPFARTRYWYTETKTQAIILDRQEYYFSQHQLFGTPILPGVAHIYYMAQFAFSKFNSQVLQLNDIQWLSPIFCEQEEDNVEIKLNHEIKDNQLKISLDNIKPHSRLIAQRMELMELSLNDKMKGCVHAYPVASIYQTFREKGWFHGPAFQGIKSLLIDQNKQCCVASIQLDSAVADENYTLAPGLFDSVLQCVSVLQGELPANQVYIPQSIQQLKLYRPWPKSFQVFCETIENSVNQVQYHITLFDENQRIITAIHAFRMVPIHLQQVVSKSQLNYLQPTWQGLVIPDAGTLSQGSVPYSQIEILDYNQLKQCMLQMKRDIDIYRRHKYIAVFKLNKSNQVFAHAWNGFLQTLTAEYSWFNYLFYVLDLAKPPVSPHPATGHLPVSGEMGKKRAVLWEENDLGNLPYTANLSGMVMVNSSNQLMSRHYQTIKPDVSSNPFKSNGHYIITGGLGGIAKQIAAYLAERYQAKILLLGRREAKDQSSWLAAHAIDYQQVDVCDQEQLAEAISRFKKQYGVIHGIIHAAGWQQDKLLCNLDASDIDAVMRVKIEGVIHLDNLLSSEKLDFFLLLSSYASILPNPGQAHYAAANAYLDSFAHQREYARLSGKRYGKTIALNSPFWTTAGMSIPKNIQARMMQEWGMGGLSAQQGINLLSQTLSCDSPQVVGINGSKERLIASLVNKKIPLSTHLAQPVDTVPPFTSKIADSNMIEQIIAEIIEQALPLDRSKSFGDLGYNSITLSELAVRLNGVVNESLTAASFYDYQTVGEFLDAFQIHPLEKLPISQNQPQSGSRIAIVGYHALLPDCKDLNDFWQILTEKKQIIKKTPAFRKAWMKTHDAAFIDKVECFDAAFFNVSPIEAKVMDPQQRLLLQTVWHALEHSGIEPSTLKGSNTGVFVGASTFDYYSQLIKHHCDNPYIPLGSVHCLFANRISYFFDLHGPSESIDTACSSGLYALHKASQSILNGECETAIVCGVNLLLADTFFESFTDSGMLSEKKRCTPFDEQADGYVRGEGVVVVILQAASTALAQNNTIHALMLQSAVNHGGKANTLTSPSSKAHRQLYEKAYAKIDKSQISYIETHGTGTPIGDPIEINGIKSFFKETEQVIHFGSLKANIGHLEPASGLASVIKVLLMMQNQLIPGQAGFNKLNPQISLENSCLKINTENQEWRHYPDAPLTVGINSFGFGGVNVHAILQAPQASLNTSGAAKRPLYPFASTCYWFAEQQIDVFYHQQRQSCDTSIVGHRIEREKLLVIHTDALKPMNELEAANTVSVVRLGEEINPSFMNGTFDRVILILNEAACLAIDEVFLAANKLAISFQTRPLTVQVFIACQHIAKITPMASAVVGLFESLSKEHPGWKCQIYCHNNGDIQSLMVNFHSSYQTLYVQDGQYYQDVLAKSTYQSNGPFLQSAPTIMVMGGFGGIGSCLCDYLVQRYAAKLIVIGRKSFAENDHPLLKKYPDAIDYLPVDVTSPNEVALALRYIEEKYTCLDAIFNCVMQLEDASVANMSLSSFKRVFATKQASILAVKQFCEKLQCRKIVLFSSVQSFACLAGQANYAAASKFFDAYAHLNFQDPEYDLRLLNWSIWQDVGAVSNPYYMNQARALGYEPIPTDMGLKWLELALEGKATQVIIQPRCEPSQSQSIPALLTGYDRANALVSSYIHTLKQQSCNNLKLFDYLKMQLFSEVLANSKQDLNLQYQQNCQEDPAYQALYELCHYCFQHYPRLLEESISANEILFSPEGSLLLEKVYSNLPESTACNEAIGSYLQENLMDVEQPIRILELGAGLGATTKAISKYLADLSIQYCYSDVSAYFLAKGEAVASQLPFPLQTQFININELSALSSDSYDVVIASNVLHLADNLNDSLHHINRILTSGGRLLINEGTKQQLALNFIFGMFELWRERKNHASFSHCPLLEKNSWLHNLRLAGFESANPLYDHNGNQVVLLAQKIKQAATRPLTTNVPMASHNGLMNTLKDTLRASLQMQPTQPIDESRPLAELGLDSITGVSFIAILNAQYSLSLKASTIFSYPTLHALHQLISEKIKEDKPSELEVDDVFLGESVYE